MYIKSKTYKTQKRADVKFRIDRTLNEHVGQYQASTSAAPPRSPAHPLRPREISSQAHYHNKKILSTHKTIAYTTLPRLCYVAVLSHSFAKTFVFLALLTS